MKILRFTHLCFLILYVIVFSAALSGQDVNLKYALQGHYPFNGDVIDVSGHHKNGNNYGAKLTTDRFHQKNSAFKFSVKDFINIPHPFQDISDEVSLAVWVQTEDDSIQTLVSKYYIKGGTGHGFRLLLQDGQAVFGGRDGSTHYRSSGLSSTLINDGDWHFLVGICRGDSWEIWVDGEKENSQYTAYKYTQLGNNLNLGLGNIPQLKENFFTGALDDLRLYKRVLSAAEIEILYKAGKITAKEEIEIRVNSSMSIWEQRGKYEKTEDYVKRVNPGSRLRKKEILTQAAIQEMGESRINWEYVERTYDPDTERFTLICEGFKPFFAEVPIEKAQLYDSNFHIMRFENVQFGLNPEGELEVLHVDILPPMRE